ncbi:ATP-binding protein [Desulfobacula toluolica]|uniref:histidine kinase n=1 Tax=Desulfobacula toluolica (strain DSM 7467 / Tol2) TaxID=651182 RepID=K0NCY6_DESTT|nr:ATP-binding protein [Desulfobacula toluolica]CCK78570.1 two component system sensor histidine kinase [Desulfobacula toluolica Tol2]
MKRLFITIYVFLVVGLFGVFYVVSPIMDEIFEEETIKANADLARGTFFLIGERLAGLDEDAQDLEIKKLRPRFGYHLAIYRIDELKIEDNEKEAFLKGLIIEAETIYRPDKDMLVQRLVGSGSFRAQAMEGPYPGDELELKVMIIFWSLAVVALILPALVWAFFLHRDIKKIEKTATQFSAGNHKARVKVSKVSSMTQIAVAFNNMAKKTQKLLESQKELGNSVSHEIRTPLARIKFSLEMLLDSLIPGHGGKNYINEIGKDVEEIESLVDEMLAYAKFEREPETSGGLSKHEMVFWLKTIIDTEKNNISEKKIRFQIKYKMDRFITRFEPVYLGWAVRNLIRNAAKYAGNNIDIIFEPGKKICSIHVDDDGPGIPENARDKIFEPFFRLDQSRNRKSGGYGLGLAIAKRIALWHRGSISVNESLAKGARFTIKLPVNQRSSGNKGRKAYP